MPIQEKQFGYSVLGAALFSVAEDGVFSTDFGDPVLLTAFGKTIFFSTFGGQHSLSALRRQCLSLFLEVQTQYFPLNLGIPFSLSCLRG